MNTFLYIGLGNVGDRFTGTRHNVGIEVLRAWVKTMAGDVSTHVSDWEEHPEYPGFESRISNPKFRIHCLFPTTMMNDSGRAVASYLKKISLPLEQMVVIHDEVEMSLGEVRQTFGGSAKGHNGVRSIQQELGTSDFMRLRLGVGRPPEGADLSDFVLQKFPPAEQTVVEEMKAEGERQLTARLSPE